MKHIKSLVKQLWSSSKETKETREDGREYLAEQLEPRVLYSGTVAPDASVDDQPVQEAPADNEPEGVGADGSPVSAIEAAQQASAEMEQFVSEGIQIAGGETDISADQDVVILNPEVFGDLGEISQAAAEGAFDAAAERWSASGVLTEDQGEALGDVSVQVADLEGDLLVVVSDDNSTILLDIDAAGRAWFVDGTPLDDSEFGDRVSLNGFRAESGAATQGVDVMTILMEAQGALLGVDGESVGREVSATGLEEGLRRIPIADEALTNPDEVTTSLVADLAQSAAQRWEGSGLSEAQLEALADIEYRVVDLSSGIIGSAEDGVISIDIDAAGKGWFVDLSPQEDSEFGVQNSSTSLRASEGAAADGVDMLSVIMHEQGHVLGLEHVEDSSTVTIMTDLFSEGDRRLIEDGQAEGAIPGSLDGVRNATVVGVTLADFQFNSNLTSSDASTDWTTSDLASGGGVPTGFDNAQGQPSPALTLTMGDINDGTLKDNDYYSFTITPNASTEIDFTQLSIDINKISGGADVQARLYSSADGFAAEIGNAIVSPESDWNTYNLDLTSLTDVTSAIEFRLYMLTTGTFAPNPIKLDNITVTGDVTTTAPATSPIAGVDFEDAAGTGFDTAPDDPNATDGISVSTGWSGNVPTNDGNANSAGASEGNFPARFEGTGSWSITIPDNVSLNLSEVTFDVRAATGTNSASTGRDALFNTSLDGGPGGTILWENLNLTGRSDPWIPVSVDLSDAKYQNLTDTTVTFYWYAPAGGIDLDAIVVNGTSSAVVSDSIDAVDDDSSTSEDTVVNNIPVLDNDSPTNGTIVSFDTTGTVGTVTENPDGTFDYDPNGQFESLAAGETAEDTFTYTIGDAGATGAADVSSGLVAHWEFDDVGLSSASGSGAVKDSATSEAGDATDDGTLQGTATTSATAAFIGTGGLDMTNAPNGDYVLIDGSPESDFDFSAGGESMTVQTWMQTDPGFDDSWEALVAKGEGNGWRLHRHNNSATNLNWSASGNVYSSGVNVNDGDWHHVVAVHDGTGTNSIYIDGQLRSSGSAGTLQNRANFMQIGGNPDAANREFDGTQDDVGIWNRAVTAEEIAALNGLGRFSKVDLQDSGINDVLNVVAAGGGLATVGSETWEFASGLTGPQGAIGGTIAGGDAFIVIDGAGNGVKLATLDTATVTVTVNGVNDAPTATANSYAVSEDDGNATIGNLITDDTGAGVDSDPDTSDSLAIVDIDTTGALGTVTVAADGSFEYDPNGAFESLAVGETAQDTFTYTVSDRPGTPLTPDWDFSSATTTEGWTVLNGGAFIGSAHGGNGLAAANSGGGMAHDGDHDTFLVSSPTVQFDTAAAAGDTMLTVTFDGGGGDQNNQGQVFNTPQEVLAFNNGNSQDANGQKGLALYRVSTGQYDATFFNPGNNNFGGPQSFTRTQLENAGVVLTQDYELHFFDNDQGGWGWTALNNVSINGRISPEHFDTATVTVTISGENDSPVAVDDTTATDEDTVSYGIIGLEDDFNDNSIDGTKWNVVTAGIPQNPKSVTETGGQIELQGRAHFNTVDEFIPSAENPITITGTWEFVSGDDFLQILTRSDGTPGGGFGETLNGIEFFAFGGNEDVRISQRVAGAGTVISSTVDMPGNISAGDVFSFEIKDNGEDLSFTLTRLSNPVDTVTVTATSTQSYSTNLISIHNRESGRRSNLDDVIVSQGVLVNDTDVDVSDTSTVVRFDAESTNGAVVNVNPDGSFTYDPTNTQVIQELDAGDTLTDTFTYTIADNNRDGKIRTVGIDISGGGSDADINNLTEAENIYAAAVAAGFDFKNGETGTVSVGAATYNITATGEELDDRVDYAGTTNRDFTPNENYPGGISGDQFLLHSEWSMLLEAGTYTIYGDGDDGFSLKLSGVTFDNKFGGGATEGAANEIRFENPTGSANTGGSFTLAVDTVINAEIIWFERTGGDYFELSIRSGASTTGAVGNDPNYTPISEGAVPGMLIASDASQFSTATVTVELTGANDAPELAAGVNNFNDVGVSQLDSDGDLVSYLVNSQISDVDDASVEGIAITGTGVSGGGGFEYSKDDGTSWVAVGTVSDSSAVLLKLTDRVRFVPDGTTTASSTLTFRAWDQTGGTLANYDQNTIDQTTKADASLTGGTTAYSTDAREVSVAIAELIKDGTEIVYAPSNGEINTLNVRFDSTTGELVFTDTTSAIQSGFDGGGTREVRIGYTSGDDLTIETGDENDIVTIDLTGSGFDGNLTVNGEDGQDKIIYKSKGIVIDDGDSVDFTAEEVSFALDSSLTVGTSSANTGGITVDATGDGSAGSGTGKYTGIDLFRSSLTVLGSGAVDLTGEGGDTGSFNSGIVLRTGSSILTENGGISLQGSVQGTTASYSSGVLITGSTVGQSGASASGVIDIDGTGGGTGALNTGVTIDFTSAVTALGTTAIDIDGTGGNGSSYGYGVVIDRGSTLSAEDGDVTVDGAGGTGGNFNVGVSLEVKSGVTVTGSGSITVTGTGGDGALFNYGVALHNGGASLETASGAISVTGTSGTGSSYNKGLLISGAGSAVRSTGGGNITLSGTSRGSASLNVGLELGSTTVDTAGDVILTGTGSSSASGVQNRGINLLNSTVTGANLTITGNGGTGSHFNEGIRVSGGSLSGALTLSGTAAGTSGLFNTGVYLLNVNLGGVTAGSSITGVGGTGTGHNHGIFMQGGTYGIFGGGANTTGTAGGGATSKDKTGAGFL